MLREVAHELHEQRVMRLVHSLDDEMQQIVARHSLGVALVKTVTTGK